MCIVFSFNYLLSQKKSGDFPSSEKSSHNNIVKIFHKNKSPSIKCNMKILQVVFTKVPNLNSLIIQVVSL
jgi:hypothetical protein